MEQGASSLSILGHRVERREDPPFLTGEARYVADLDADGALHAVFVRSMVAHGLLRSVDTSEALAAGGVVGVFTAEDLDLPDLPEWPRPDAAARPELGRPCLARERVRFVGEAIAVVVAETLAEAVDAQELVVIDIEELPAVLDPLEASAEDAPVLFPSFGSNVVLEAPPSDDGDVLEGAEAVVRARFTNQRVAPVPMEPNGALVRPLPDGGLECFVSCQAPFAVRAGIARALGKDESEIWVRVPAVGGGFGAKGGVYPEQIVVAAVADRLGRPVSYVETRSENLLAMSHGRGQRQEVAIGARRDGTIVGLEARTVTEMGAYCWRGTIPFSTSRLMATGVYRIPRLKLTSLGVVTNTSPTGPYRGAGRPEAAAMLERVIELLAAELGMDSIELRRRNFIRPDEFPYRTLTGASYDSGEYEGALDAVLEHAGYTELRAEQASRRSSGDTRQLGIGISTFVEISGSGPEYGGVAVEPDGTVVVTSGSSPHGQGHETTLTQLVSGLFHLPAERVRVVHSDTRAVPHGVGTFGSRSGQLAGNAVHNAGRTVLERAREAAADLLEAAAADVVQGEDGAFFVAGVPARPVSLAEIAASVPGELAAGGDFSQQDGTYPIRGAPRRGRGRHRDRTHAAAPPRGRRRLRRGHQPDHRRRPGARRPRPRDRPGPLRGGPVRRGRQPAHDEPGRLRDPDGGGAPELRGPRDRDALAEEPPRDERDRRVRHGRLCRRRAERRPRRPCALRGAPPRHAAHAREDLAGARGGAPFLRPLRLRPSVPSCGPAAVVPSRCCSRRAVRERRP